MTRCIMSSSEVILGKTKRGQDTLQRQDRDVGGIQKKVTFVSSFLVPVPVVHLVFHTFMSLFWFLYGMSGRVWHVIHASTPVTHPPHVWSSLAHTPPNSENKGPHSEAEHRQNTTTTKNLGDSVIIAKSFSSATCRK
jgi:hypothetical protein